MPIAYPPGLRTVLRSSKSRSQPAAFRITEPRRGYAYAQDVGTDTPVFWDVEFCFTTEESLVFQLWGTQGLNNWRDEFTMPLRTEFGVLTHTCRFLSDGLLPTSERGALWSYKATIMARAQLIPQYYLDLADFIVTVPDWRAYMGLLDQTINDEMPVP